MTQGLVVESRHGALFKQKLKTRRSELLEAMARGLDQQNYQHTVGRVLGLADAIELSDEADRELNGTTYVLSDER